MQINPLFHGLRVTHHSGMFFINRMKLVCWMLLYVLVPSDSVLLSTPVVLFQAVMRFTAVLLVTPVKMVCVKKQGKTMLLLCFVPRGPKL